MIQLGIYRHYKGPLYLVLGLAHDADADRLGNTVRTIHDGPLSYETVVPLGERTVVVYVPLQLDGAHLGPRMAVRTLEHFTERVEHESLPLVVWRDGSTGHYAPRFQYLGPVLTAEMVRSQPVEQFGDDSWR